MPDEAMGQVPSSAPGPGLRVGLGIALLILAAGGFGLWMMLSSAG